MNTVYDSELRMSFADRSLYMLESGKANEKQKEKIIKGLLDIEPLLYQSIKNNDEQPNHLYQYIARIYEQKYLLYKDPEDLVKLEDILNEAFQFNPDVSDLYQITAELRVLQNRETDVEDYVKKSCALDIAGCKSEYSFYKKIAITYLRTKKYELAAENYQKVLDIDYKYKKDHPILSDEEFKNIFNSINSLAIIYCLNLKDVDSCKKVYENAGNVFPEYKVAFNNYFKMFKSQVE
jgi:tetratricopeptide (TPR) repeat protein